VVWVTVVGLPFGNVVVKMLKEVTEVVGLCEELLSDGDDDSVGLLDSGDDGIAEE